MTREDPQLKLRLPEGLKEQVEAAAKAAGRSMNAEIVARLLESFDKIGTTTAATSARSEDEMRLIYEIADAEIALRHTVARQDYLRDRVSILDLDEPGQERELAALRGELMAIWDKRGQLEKAIAARHAKLQELRGRRNTAIDVG